MNEERKRNTGRNQKIGKRITALLLAVTLIFGCIGTEANAAAQGFGSGKTNADAQAVNRTDAAVLEHPAAANAEAEVSEHPAAANAEAAASEHPAAANQAPQSLQRDVSPDDAQKPGTPEEPVKEYCTVTFNFKSGRLKNDPDTSKLTMKVEKGQALSKAMAPELLRPGYLFQGWKDTAGASYSFGQPLSGNLTLNASWKAITYKIHFNPNGGTGSMNDQSFTYGKTKTLAANKYKRSGYTFIGWNTKKEGTGTSYANKEKVKSLSQKQGETIHLYAMWQGYSYRIHYEGNGATSGAMADSVHVYGTKSLLNKNSFKRKGYTFAGWNTQMDGKGKTYKDKAAVTDLTAAKNQTITLYAKWKAITYKITYKPNKGKMPSSVRKSYKVNTKTFTLPKPTRKGYDFDGWYKDKKFKKRADQIKTGSTGNLTLYAKWVKCTRKPTANAAKIKSCKAVKTSTVQVKATVKNRIASSDDYYYLVYMDPIRNTLYKMAAKAYKKKNITFTLKTTDNQGYATSKFGIAVKKDKKYHLISNASFVSKPEKAAGNKTKYNPGKTKKGIQFYSDVNEITDCNAKQYFLNLTVSMLADNGTVPYLYNGKTYYFNSMDYYKQIVQECNRKKVVVTMQIMLDWHAGNTDLINLQARKPGALYYSWNIYSNASREKMEAMFCYLGMIFGQKNCYVSNWVLGNEVNHPAGWNYAGSMSDDAYFQTYAYAFRALYYAVRSQQANAHIFICTDNYWSPSRGRRYGAKQVIDNFAVHLNKIQKGLKWNLAYHAYSFPLTYTRVWNGYGITNTINTPSVTMKNLKVLTDYIKNTYGSSVRIILSEQGYSSGQGEDLQAAALAYSYYIAACNPMIDAFIIRSYKDDPVEVAQGFLLGIQGKEAFDVFKYMDTSQASQYTDKYLGVIGAGSWSQVVPGYKASRIRSMYRR